MKIKSGIYNIRGNVYSYNSENINIRKVLPVDETFKAQLDIAQQELKSQEELQIQIQGKAPLQKTYGFSIKI